MSWKLLELEVDKLDLRKMPPIMKLRKQMAIKKVARKFQKQLLREYIRALYELPSSFMSRVLVVKNMALTAQHMLQNAILNIDQ